MLGRPCVEHLFEVAPLQASREAHWIDRYMGFSRNDLSGQTEAFVAPVPDDVKELTLVASLLADNTAKHLERLCSLW